VLADVPLDPRQCSGGIRPPTEPGLGHRFVLCACTWQHDVMFWGRSTGRGLVALTASPG
jgi:hypothetical protein